VPKTIQLLLLSGATGSGKSTILALLRSRFLGSVYVGRKYTTRARRNSDCAWEARHVDSLPHDHSLLAFEDVGAQYAVALREAAAAVDRGLVYAISCSDQVVRQALKNRYRACHLFVYRDWSRTGGSFGRLLDDRGVQRQDDRLHRWKEHAHVPDHLLQAEQDIDEVLLNVGTIEQLGLQFLRTLSRHGIAPDVPLGIDRGRRT